MNTQEHALALGAQTNVGVLTPQFINPFKPALPEIWIKPDIKVDLEKKETQPLTNLELKAEFLKWLAVDRANDTIESYHNALKVFFDWLDSKEKSLLVIKVKDFVQYNEYLEHVRRVKGSTRNHYFTAIRTMWRWIYREGHATHLKEEDIPKPRVNDREHYPYAEDKEIEKIINSFSDFFPIDIRNKAIVSLMYATGVRLGELRSIDVTSLDLDIKKGTVKTFKRKNHFRDIYWGHETNEILKKWIDTRTTFASSTENSVSNGLFINLSSNNLGRRIDRHAIQKMFRQKRKELGIKKKISPHSLRHGFGHKGVTNEVHPRHLQVMMGHAKLDTTMGYMGYSNKEVEKTYRSKMAS